MLDELKTSKNSSKKLYKINRKGYFYTVTKSNSMTRMNLSQLIQFLINENYVALAMDFSDIALEDCVDGEIDANLVKSMVEELDPSGLLLRKIQANVTSYLYLEC